MTDFTTCEYIRIFICREKQYSLHPVPMIKMFISVCVLKGGWGTVLQRSTHPPPPSPPPQCCRLTFGNPLAPLKMLSSCPSAVKYQFPVKSLLKANFMVLENCWAEFLQFAISRSCCISIVVFDFHHLIF